MERDLPSNLKSTGRPGVPYKGRNYIEKKKIPGHLGPLQTRPLSFFLYILPDPLASIIGMCTLYTTVAG